MTRDLTTLNIALVHDRITGISGTERVLQALNQTFPKAPIYTLLYNKSFTDQFLPNAQIISQYKSSSRLPKLGQLGSPWYITATETIDVGLYDIVISSSVAFTKGLIVKPKTLHINYCHSPTRQLWDWHKEYQKESHKMPAWLGASMQHLGRMWDFQAAQRVDEYVANSSNIQERIKKYYRRTSTVIHPPVTMADMISREDRGYYLIVSRLFKHKNIEPVIQACTKLGRPLVVIGEGPEYKKLKRIAGHTVKLLGFQPDNIVRRYFARCRGFIMPQEEDFGISTIEAMSFGKPVLALRRGGALEYIAEGTNGMFLEAPTEEVIAYNLNRFNRSISDFDPHIIRSSVERFSDMHFKDKITDFVKIKYTDFSEKSRC